MICARGIFLSRFKNFFFLARNSWHFSPEKYFPVFFQIYSWKFFNKISFIGYFRDVRMSCANNGPFVIKSPFIIIPYYHLNTLKFTLRGKVEACSTANTPSVCLIIIYTVQHTVVSTAADQITFCEDTLIIMIYGIFYRLIYFVAFSQFCCM